MEEAPVALGAVWENVALRQWARVAASTERYGRVRLLLWAGDGQMRRAQNAPVRTWSMRARSDLIAGRRGVCRKGPIR